MSDIVLTSAQTATLSSIKNTTTLFNSTQSQLNSGKKVNSAIDDAVAYFQSESLYNRSSALTTRKSQTDQSIQSLNAAISATSAVGALLAQLKAIITGAKGAPLSNRVSDTAQFKSIGNQLAQLVKDASYNGLNLLSGTQATLSTQFSERTAATLTVNGFNLISSQANKNSLFTGVSAFSASGKLVASNIIGAAGFSALNTQASVAANAQSAASILTKASNALDAAISQNQAVTASLGANVTILQTRSSFASNYTSVLNAGGDKLTLADLNTEAANSQSLTLRQQIGIQSLSIEGQQQQSILNLLK